MDEQKYILELRKEWDELKKNSGALGTFLSERSGLPGSVNMALAMEAVELASNLKDARRIVDKWLMSKDEYLGVVAILLLGRLMEVCPEDRENALPIMEYAVINRRWRLREAVTLALRNMADANVELARGILTEWTVGGYPIMYVVALDVFSDMFLLKKKPVLMKDLRNTIINAMAEITAHPGETGEPMRLLKEKLGTSIRTLVMYDPNALELMYEWGKSPHLRGILKASLSDKKLRRKYPDEIASLLEYLETGRR